jgi:hypothetical protein
LRLGGLLLFRIRNRVALGGSGDWGGERWVGGGGWDLEGIEGAGRVKRLAVDQCRVQRKAITIRRYRVDQALGDELVRAAKVLAWVATSIVSAILNRDLIAVSAGHRRNGSNG